MNHGKLSRIAKVMSFAAVVLYPALSGADGAEMEIIIDDRAVVFAGISEPVVKELAKANGFDSPSEWPVLKTTGHPDYTLPPGVAKRAKSHPEWQLNRLYDYRVAYRDWQWHRVVLLYRREARILILLYYSRPKTDLPGTDE